jgi:hypothetical protein
MNKKIWIAAGILFLLTSEAFIVSKFQQKEIKLPLPPTDTISPNSNEIVCHKIIGSEVYGVNNPESKGLVAHSLIPGQDNSNLEIGSKIIKINIDNDVLKFNGRLSTGNEYKYDWKIETNTDKLLVASLLTPEEEGSTRREYYSIFIDKKIGHGLVSSSKEFQYVNMNLTGFVSYLTCQGK